MYKQHPELSGGKAGSATNFSCRFTNVSCILSFFFLGCTMASKHHQCNSTTYGRQKTVKNHKAVAVHAKARVKLYIIFDLNKDSSMVIYTLTTNYYNLQWKKIRCQNLLTSHKSTAGCLTQIQSPCFS